MAFKMSFHKGPCSLFGKLIRWFEGGPYNHCELHFSDDWGGSALGTKGVYIRKRLWSKNDWDEYELPAHLEPAARKFIEERVGKSYDWRGILSFLLTFLPISKDKWYCSRLCPAAIGMEFTGGPNALAAEIKKRAEAGWK